MLFNSNCAEGLLSWFDINKRSMPWRDSKDPYAIWVSEIMLQQTRVNQALPFFNRFMKAFPSLQHLAAASTQQVLKQWEGLGYYSRARNIHKTAQLVIENYSGILPNDYEKLLSFPGIGPYTAAAIASIAFDLEYAVMDGNVIRTVTRFCGIEQDTRKIGTRKIVQQKIDQWIKGYPPSGFNQAMMELGAMICTPIRPACQSCPLAFKCVAYRSNKTEQIPYTSKKAKRPHQAISVAIILNDKGEVLIAQRPLDAMLGGLWEFPGGKQKNNETSLQALHREIKEELGIEVSVIEVFMSLNHAYSHFTITLSAYLCVLKPTETLQIPTAKASDQIKWVSIQDLENYPFPKANKTITIALMKKFA
ncbi:MAG: A/G-specific adenine glycosylase [Balneola sp.]|nr:A/G-specific adenine glycosylase [Balneola sp.]